MKKIYSSLTVIAWVSLFQVCEATPTNKNSIADIAVEKPDEEAKPVDFSNFPEADIRVPKIKIIQKDNVFFSKEDNCHYKFGVSKEGDTEETVNLNSVGFHRNAQDGGRGRHCRTEGLIKQKQDLEDFMCSRSYFLFSVDRSNSMIDEFSVVRQMVNDVKIRAKGENRVIVTNANDIVPIILGGRGEISDKEWDEFLVPQGGADEQVFEGALLALKEVNVSSDSCLHVILMTDELESKMAPRKFLRRLWGSCEKCKRIFVHTAFNWNDNSMYGKARNMSYGISMPSKDLDSKRYLAITNTVTPLPIPIVPQGASYILSAHSEEDNEKYEEAQMEGFGQAWEYVPEYRAIIPKQDASFSDFKKDDFIINYYPVGLMKKSKLSSN